MREIVSSLESQWRYYKKLGESAIQQVRDNELGRDAGGNSIAIIVWHIAGNLASRFTDFLSSDGEKPWRDRESEFLARSVTLRELLEKWEKGWAVLLEALAGLEDAQLPSEVKIRGVGHSVLEALHRSLSHTAYHVGQVVFLAKMLRAGEWRYLTIPPGGSAAYNADP